MSPGPRPASAPSDLGKPLVKSENGASSYQHTIGQSESIRGRRPELQIPQKRPPTVQVRDERQQTTGDTISPASQPSRYIDEAANGSAAHDSPSEAQKVDPWKRKTLLTLGINTVMSMGRVKADTGSDGGGVRGYSSLLILRELMKQIAALEQDDPHAPSSVSPLSMRRRPSVPLAKSRSSTSRMRVLESSDREEYGPKERHLTTCHVITSIT